MKRMILGFGLIILLACTANNKTVINYINIESFAVDMSVYEDMPSLKHNYKGITPTTFLDVYDAKGSGAFYIGFSSCPHCQTTVKCMNKAAENLDVTIYYIDADNKTDPLINHYDEFYTILYPVLEEIDGEKAILTPHYFTLINGEIATSYVGGLKASEKSTIENFEKLLEPLK